MSVMIQGKEVSGLVIGGDTFVRDNGWVPLELPEGMTGQVFFKNNSDGTAFLAGIMSFYYQGTPLVILQPPIGIRFTDVSWNFDSKDVGVSKAISGLNQLEGSPSHSVDSFNTKIDNGCLVVIKPNFANVSGALRTILFSKNSTVNSSIDSSPAIIKIEEIKE